MQRAEILKIATVKGCCAPEGVRDFHRELVKSR